jgi:hypothetical protein
MSYMNWVLIYFASGQCLKCSTHKMQVFSGGNTSSLIHIKMNTGLLLFKRLHNMM